MRRFAPILILVIGLAALFIDFLPGLKVPVLGDPQGASRRLETKLGLDLEGGLSVQYQAQPVGDKAPTQGDMETLRTIMENRVNSTGVAEPIVQTQGADRIVVELPGAVDVDTIRTLVGETGRLDFVPLPSSKYGTSSAPGPQQAVENQPLPTQEHPLFSGDQIASANPSTDQQGNRAVAFSLKGDGAKLFGDYTSTHVNEFFAIVLDGRVVSAPRIESA